MGEHFKGPARSHECERGTQDACATIGDVSDIVEVKASMRCIVGLLIVLTLGSCSNRETQRDQSSAAFKAGEAAHEIAKHAEKTAAAAGRELKESARKASEGWKQKEKEDREKARQDR
jgi:hypothetical protein